MKNSVADHQQWLAAERSGCAFLAWDDLAEQQHIVVLDGGATRWSIGRQDDAEVALTDDRQVSRSHAVIERVGADWVMVDEGLSRNGTWVNGERMRRRRRLVNGDRIRVGRTSLLFVDPRVVPPEDDSTDVGSVLGRLDMLTTQQYAVLDALCAPLRANRYAAPASNAEIAQALHLSVDSVKGHLRMLFRAFGIAGVPQNKKRSQLAEIGAKAGLGSK